MEIWPIQGIPLVNVSDDIPSIVVSALKEINYEPRDGDVLVVTQSIVSIAEGKVYNLKDLEISERARSIAERTNRTPEVTEIALREAEEIIVEEPVLITRTKHGHVTDYSGVDASNAPVGMLISLPDNPDKSAKAIHDEILKSYGTHVPVIISDTQGRPWRKGAINFAIGIAGMSPFIDNKGKTDLHGRILKSSLVCLADELASAAELVMGQANEGIPVVLIRGVKYSEANGTASDIIRTTYESLF